MKFNLIFIFCFITRLCFGLDSGHHLKYKYSASFKVGIPDDGDQVAGLAFKAIVDVFVEDNDGISVLKLSEVSTLNFNEELGIGEEIDFTDERFKPFEDEDLKRIVEQPFRANLRDSEPFAIEYEETDHRWLSNVLKGIALMLKNEILKGNFETQEKDSVSSLFHQGHLVNNFIVEEETLFGICKAKYKIYEIPETMFSGSNDLTPTRQEGARNDLWHVSRSIDLDNCKEIVAMHVHTTNNRRHKQKKLDFTRTSVSSYVLRGSPGHFDVYSVVTEGATTYPLSSFKEQEAQSTVKQKLVLIDESTSEVPELGTNLKRSATWMHELWSPFQTPKESKPHPWIVYSKEKEPEIGYEIFGTKKYDVDQIATVKVKILELIKGASQRLTDIYQEAGDPPPDAISESLEMVTVYFRFLKKKDILKIFDHIFEDEVGIERQLVINAAASTGFNEAMEAIMDYMEEGKIEPFQVFTTFIMLSRNSFGSLNVSRIMDFLLQQEELSKYLLSLAHYLSEYCIHKTHTYVPIAGDAECDSSLITKRFIPYLKDIIYNEDLTWERAYAVKVLDLLRSGFTFEIVSPLIDGRMKSSVSLKAMAVRALENWHIYPENPLRTPIIDLLTDVYSDVSQDFNVRVAALLAVTSWQPTTKFWYNLALRTWKDPSNEFASFASSLIKIYAEGYLPMLEKRSKGAAFALKFSKPISEFVHSQNVVITIAFFNRRVKISVLNPKGEIKHPYLYIANIFSNIKQLTLIGAEANSLYYERVTNFNETVQKDRSNFPGAEFLNKLYSEINYEEHPSSVKQFSNEFMNILNDVFIETGPLMYFNFLSYDKSNPLKHYWGTYLYLTDKSDFLPNELGLPLYTHSSLPTAASFTTKFLPPTSELISGSDFLLRLSSVYSAGISIFLPWNHQFCTAYVRSNLELILPIGTKNKRTVGTEGPLVSRKTNFDIVYKKKFPLLRLSNTPMTIIYDSDPKAENLVINYEVIKKLNVREKRINTVNSLTGIKYDLVMSADTPNFLSLRNLLQFPEMPARVWSFDLYLDPEESETSEIVITNSIGKLLTTEEYEGSGFDHYSEEKSQVNFHDNFEERSHKIRKLLKNKKGRVTYWEYKIDFIGNVSRHFEAFNTEYYSVNVSNGNENTLQTLGFTFSGTELQTHIPTPRSVCFNLHNNEYSDIDKYYYDSSPALQNYHAKESTLEVLLGCTKNILTTNVVYNVSEERLSEAKEYCKANYGKEKCYVENDDLLDFDDIEITTTHEGKIPFIEDFLKILPVAGFDYEIPRYDSKFNIRRNTYNGNWDLYLKTNSETIHLSSFPENIFFRFFLYYPNPFDGVNNVYDTPKSYFKCTLTDNSVKTFDGINFNYELSDCWTLVSAFEGEETQWSNVFLIRKPQGGSSVPDFKYIINHSGTVIDFSNNEIKVNGSVVHKILEEESDPSETIENGLIKKKGNIYLINAYPGKGILRPHIIITKDKIEYFKEQSRIFSNGICGNGDGETIPELIGPKKCVYDDGQIFTASWTGQSENCDSATLKEYRKGVEDYQTKCEPFYGQLKESPMNHRCLFYGWKTLVTSENNYCISARPLPLCSSDCDIKEVKTIKIPYMCWPKEKSPERLRTSIENKVDIVTDPISADPYFYEYLSTEIAKICKHI